MKHCSNPQCSQINPQPVTAFGLNRTKTDGYNNQCRTCVNELAATRYRRHRKLILARNKAWRRANNAYMTQLHLRWVKEHPEQARKTRLAHRVANLAHRREVERMHAARRRALKRGAPSDKSTASDVIAAYGDICYLCAKRVYAADLHIDHVMPLARGGSDILDNKRATHAWCNMSKGAKLVDFKLFVTTKDTSDAIQATTESK